MQNSMRKINKNLKERAKIKLLKLIYMEIIINKFIIKWVCIENEKKCN